MSIAVHDAHLLGACPPGCARRRLHVHIRALSSGEVSAVGTGGLTAVQFGRHVICFDGDELDDYSLAPDGSLVDHGAHDCEAERCGRSA